MSTQTRVPNIGNIYEETSVDMNFERKASVSPSQLKLAQMSPSRRRAALRTKTFTSDVNPALYAAWDELREAKELTVVRAFELSLISFLNDSGTDFKL